MFEEEDILTREYKIVSVDGYDVSDLKLPIIPLVVSPKIFNIWRCPKCRKFNFGIKPKCKCGEFVIYQFGKPRKGKMRIKL